jgi:hypothetical protein
VIGATIDQGDFDRGEWMQKSASPQISELTVVGFKGRMAAPKGVFEPPNQRPEPAQASKMRM